MILGAGPSSFQHTFVGLYVWGAGMLPHAAYVCMYVCMYVSLSQHTDGLHTCATRHTSV